MTLFHLYALIIYRRLIADCMTESNCRGAPCIDGNIDSSTSREEYATMDAGDGKADLLSSTKKEGTGAGIYNKLSTINEYSTPKENTRR
jgi:hypothetical protein